MSNSGKAGSGRGNNRRRPFRRREAEKSPENTRPKWSPAKTNTEILPSFACPYCGKPIRDVISAIEDKETGVPIHFDCVTSRISFGEKLEKGEAIIYIGGGRFGIVSFSASKNSQGKHESSAESKGPEKRGSPTEHRDFKIKKVIEWEKKDTKAEWRSAICERYLEV